ncbi:MAG TPA: hypothetical protein PL139_07095, partial [Candidatus Cloacimonadota bacterium]|nr:hypothetical protein [Candidatus Cloacimonadota bacterium]
IRALYSHFFCKFLNQRSHLFEYQAIHFGISGVVRSEGYYVHEENQWQFVKVKTVFEVALAEAFDKYVKLGCAK